MRRFESYRGRRNEGHALAISLLVLVVAGGAWLASDRGPDRPPSTSSGLSTSTTAVDLPITSSVAPPRSVTTTGGSPTRAPTLVVAYRPEADDTVVLDLTEGRFEVISGAASDIYPTYAGPVDGTVYLDRSLHPAEIASLSLASGAVTRIDDGSNPAVTADGRFLAYSAGGGAAVEEAAIVVRDLGSGSERRFATIGPPGSSVTVADLSWSADGQRLAFLRGQHDPDGEPGASSQRQVRVLDLEQDADLDAATTVRPADPGVTWTLPSFRGRLGTLAVVEQSTTKAVPGSRLLSVDPTTGEVLAPLLDLELPVRSLDADESGLHLLYSVEEPQSDPATGLTFSLYRWSGDDAQLVGSGLTSGVWQ